MGKKGHDLPKILRQELVLNIVENFAGTSGISTSEVLELLDKKCPGVNRRTLLRDLQELSMRYPVFDETIDGKSLWFINDDLKNFGTRTLYREIIQKELVDYLSKPEEELASAV